MRVTHAVPPGDRKGRPYGETRQWCIAGDGALDVPLSLPPLQGEVVLSRLRRKTGGVTPQSPP